MNYTPLKIVLEKDYWKDVLMIKRHYEAESNIAYFIIGLTFVIFCYAYRTGIYQAILGAIQAASDLVGYIEKIL